MDDHRSLRVVEESSRLATDALRELSRRLDGYRKSVDLGSGWERGVPGDWLEAILEDWRVFDTGALNSGSTLCPSSVLRSQVPTTISIFGGERVPFPKPPQQLAERYYNVTSWAEHPTGGHFPAVAEPELLARTLRDAFRPAEYRA